MMKLQYVVRRCMSEVDILKEEQCPLGISIAGCHKDRDRPIITNIKHGSVAQKSHCLSDGDVILSVRGMDTKGMRKKDVKSFFKDSNPNLNMTLEYMTREASFGYCKVCSAQRMYLTLRKANGSFGFVLRKSNGCIEYPIISSIKRGSPADRGGIMMDGDRLLEIDNQSLCMLPLPEVVKLLQDKEEVLLLIEYNVGIVDISKEKEIHLEISFPVADLGMTVVSDDSSNMFISFIQQGSLAQRCGVLHMGDEILSINGVDVKTVSSPKANDLLRQFRKGSGKLTFLHKGENLKLETSVCSTSKEKRSSPSVSICNPVPPNSFDSSYFNPIPVDDFFKRMENYETHNNYQLKIMSILGHMQTSTDSIQLNLSNEINDTSFPKSEIVDANGSCQSDKNSIPVKLKRQVHELMKLMRTLVIHVVRNSAQINHDFGNGPPTPTNQITKSAINDTFKIEFVDVLNEFASKRLVSKSSAKKLIEAALELNRNCLLCVNEFYAVSFAVRKVHLLLSLNNITQQDFDIILHVLKRVCRSPFPCYDCTLPLSAESTIGTESCQTVKKVENNTIPMRTVGVGVSSSSTDSRKYTQKNVFPTGGSQMQVEPQIALNLPQNNVQYRRKENENTASGPVCSSGEINTLSSGQSNFTQYHQDAINYHVYNDADLKYKPNLVPESDTPSQPNSTLTTTHSKASSTLTSLTEVARQREISNEDKPSLTSAWPKYAYERHSTPLPPSLAHKPLCQCKSSMGFDVQKEDPLIIAGSSHVLDSSGEKINPDKTSSENHHTVSHDVMLKADNGKFGLILGHSSLLPNASRVPIIWIIKPNSPAQRCGVLKKGDRILALNGFSTTGISVGELDSLQRELFSLDEIVLTVEFDVMDPDVIWGTFTIQLESCIKLGLVMDEPNNSTFVRGVIKGSASHRCGQLFPGDEILSFTILKEETFDLQTWKTQITKLHRLTVLRKQNNEPRREKTGKRSVDFDFPFGPKSFVQSGPHFNIKRTSIRTMEGLKGHDKMILEQEFTLFRDPLTWDFGFLFGEDPQTGNAYITDIRPGSPADNSKIIKKYDRIIEVNGVLIDKTPRNSIMSTFVNADDRITLVTRRYLHYRY